MASRCFFLIVLQLLTENASSLPAPGAPRHPSPRSRATAFLPRLTVHLLSHWSFAACWLCDGCSRYGLRPRRAHVFVGRQWHPRCKREELVLLGRKGPFQNSPEETAFELDLRLKQAFSRLHRRRGHFRHKDSSGSSKTRRHSCLLCLGRSKLSLILSSTE